MEPVHQGIQLIAPKRLKELSRKSDLRGWLKTLSHIGAIAVNTAALAYFWGGFLAVPLFMTQGILLVCLYAGVHEYSHRTVFKTRALNEIFGRLFALTILVVRSADKYEHTAHHLYTNDLDRDAEIAGQPPFNLRSYTLYFIGVAYWYGRINSLFSLALGSGAALPFLTPAQRRDSQIEARQNLAVYGVIAVAAVALQSWAPLTLWLLPMFSMKFVQQCQNLTEHTGMPHVKDILENTRTIKTSAIMRWLLWNMPYHTAHHRYPSVPFFRLPQLHREMFIDTGRQPPTIGFIAFQWRMFRKLFKENSSRYAGKSLAEY